MRNHRLGLALGLAWIAVCWDAAHARGISERHVWAERHAAGQAVVTVLWADASALGIVPGDLDWAAWREEDRLLFQTQPLSMPMYGSAQRRSVPVAAPQLWEIQMREPLGRMSAGAAGDGAAYFEMPMRSASPDGSGQAVAQALAEGIHIASMAYMALHQWDFRQAANLYKKAARHVADLPNRFGDVLPVAFEGYAQALDAAAEEAATSGSRRVCREHLSVIGDLLVAYREAHAGVLPDDLEGLRAWARMDGDRDALNRVFRSPADPQARLNSYFYRPDAASGEATAISFYYPGRLIELIETPDGFVVQDRVVGQVQADSLLAAGVALLETAPTQAVGALELVTRVFPKFAAGHNKLGYAYLKTGHTLQARAAFDRAVQLDHKLAEAYNGLGLVFRDHPKGRYDAIRYFRRALQWQPDYIDARFNMACLRLDMKEYDARRDLERVIAQDGQYAPAFLMLGTWYEEEEDLANAALSYARYLSLRPDDAEGRKRLAGVYIRTKDFDQITALLENYARENPGEIEILPILAQACLELGRLDWAQAYFTTYVNNAPAHLQALYEDIRFLASNDELEELNSLAGEDRARFLREFWSLRDPDLSTSANERRLEHYRRVWYALTHFSGGRKPWDRRGEVYIRFGEPEYRSRSNMMNMEQSMAVQRVKERMAHTLYGREATQRSYFGPVYPVRGLRTGLSGLPDMRPDIPDQVLRNAFMNRENLVQASSGAEERRQDANTQLTGDDRTGSSEATMQRIASMDVVTTGASINAPAMAMSGGGVFAANPFDFRSEFQPMGVGEDGTMVRWESWVYTDISGGMEITFTDEAMTGNFNYAPPPLDVRLPIRQLALLNRYSPERVVELAGRMTPNYYATPQNQAPLPFYYDVVDFRGGADDRSAVEIYTGVPRAVGFYAADEDVTRLEVERVVALINEETGDVYRRSGQIRFEGQGDLRQPPGAFVPDVVRIEAPPGQYRLEVQLHDRFSGRQGRYRQDVSVENYRARMLKVSDLQLAWRIVEGGPEDKFRKGDLHVVPMPTRLYAQGQSIFVYYEIYNLERDEFGQTNYQVEYTIGRKEGFLTTNVLSRLVQTLKGEKNQVAVGYEQVGTGETEMAFAELDLGEYSPGRHYVKVMVTDLNTGRKSEKEALFVVAK